MNLFYLSSTPLMAILLLVVMVFAASFALNRHQQKQTKLISSGLMSLATFFCLETFVVSNGLIPPFGYVEGRSTDQGPQVLNDWVSSAAVNVGDLYIAWILVIGCVMSAYYVKRNALKALPHSRAHFYDHFGATGAIAVLITSFIYQFMVIPGYFDGNIQLLDKILFRGVIPYITVGLFVWVILNVFLLARRVIFQRSQDQLIEFYLDNDEKGQAFANASDNSTLKHRFEQLGDITGAQNVELIEYSQLVEQQSEMEREDVTVSILYLHTAMWAIPVLGFLGTVWGIAEAVANLIPLLKGLSASELGGGQLADSLAGLGVAFDTTLVALSLSLPAMALISLLEKTAFEDMLVRNRIILRHIRSL